MVNRLMDIGEALALAEEWATEVADPMTTYPPYIEAVAAVTAEVRRLLIAADQDIEDSLSISYDDAPDRTVTFEVKEIVP